MVLWKSDIQNSIVFTPVEIRSKKGRKTMKKAKTAIYIPNMDADTFEKICQEKGLQFVYVEVLEHGRLIDADAFCEKRLEIVERQKYDDFYAESLSVGAILREVVNELNGSGLAWFSNAPTISPADKEEIE